MDAIAVWEKMFRMAREKVVAQLVRDGESNETLNTYVRGVLSALASSLSSSFWE